MEQMGRGTTKFQVEHSDAPKQKKIQKVNLESDPKKIEMICNIKLIKNF